MKNIRIIVLCTLLVSLAIGRNAQAQKPGRNNRTVTMGADGRMIVHPSNWKTSMGADGRMITYPPNWKTSMDANGRMIAYPPDWKTSMGADGRMIAYPSDWRTSMGADGRMIAIPTNNEIPDLENGEAQQSSLLIYYLVNLN